MPFKIYDEQIPGGEKQHPFNYMPDDITYRLPWFMGEIEPPLKATYPLIMKDERGRKLLDPLTIYIGRTASRRPFAYNPRYVVNPLLLVVGTPGAGKSSMVKTFIYNLLRNEHFLEKGQKIPPVIVVDPEGEYAILRQLLNPGDVLHLKLGRRDYINIFDRPSKSISPLAWYMRMMGVIQKFLKISPSQAVQAYRVLKLAIQDLAEKRGFTQDPHSWIKDDITLEDVHKWVQNKIEELESQNKMKPSDKTTYRGALTLASRLDQWMYPPNDAFSYRSTVDLSRIFQYKLIVLDSRGLAKDLFGLFSYWITYWIYGLMLEKGPLPSFGIRVVLIIDEAWSLLRKTENKEEENPLDSLARRGRKYGILIVVATQTPEDVDKKMFSLFGTMVTGIIPSDEMVKKVVESRGMPERFKHEIKVLRQGELVWSINWRKRDFPMSGIPLVVQTDYPIKESVQVRIT